MKRENVIIVVIVTFIVGYIAGAVGGIKFYERFTGRGGKAPSQAASRSSADDVKRLEDTVGKEPTNLAALIDLGNLYFDSNRYYPAIEMYKRALAIDPKNPDVRTDLGVMYRAVKDYDGAVREFREAARIDPKHTQSRFNLGIVLQEDKKDTAGAVAAWEDFLRVEASGEKAEMARAQIARLKEAR